MTTARRFAAVARSLVPAGGRAPTGRQLVVARLAILEGRTNAQIAEALGLSPRTVESHRRDFAQRLGLGFRAAQAEITRRLLEAA